VPTPRRAGGACERRSESRQPPASFCSGPVMRKKAATGTPSTGRRSSGASGSQRRRTGKRRHCRAPHIRPAAAAHKVVPLMWTWPLLLSRAQASIVQPRIRRPDGTTGSGPGHLVARYRNARGPVAAASRDGRQRPAPQGRRRAPATGRFRSVLSGCGTDVSWCRVRLGEQRRRPPRRPHDSGLRHTRDRDRLQRGQSSGSGRPGRRDGPRHRPRRPRARG
jgi:hypothetical protein